MNQQQHDQLDDWFCNVHNCCVQLNTNVHDPQLQSTTETWADRQGAMQYSPCNNGSELFVQRTLLDRTQPRNAASRQSG